jgi:integrase
MGYRVKLLNKEIGDRLVTHILPVDLQNYREKRKKNGVALATIDDEITQAKMIVKKAWENKKVSANTLYTFLSIKNLLKSNANARNEIYTKEQFEKLINHKHCSQYLKGILATAFYTGMRKGEILNLTRDKVDLNNRRIKLEAIDTKTGEPRTCPICNELYRILKKIPRALHDPHVFLYNGKPIDDIKTTFKTLCEKAKVPYGRKVKGGLTFHDLRHSFNTYMRKAGVDKEVIKAITGHSTDSMFTRYNKIDRDDIDQAVEKLEVFLNGK